MNANIEDWNESEFVSYHVSHLDNKLYYDYENMKKESKLSKESPYEKKLKIIPEIIYPEYKLGQKQIHELANYYKIEQYLIEEYIQKMDDDKTKDDISHESSLSSLENKLMKMEQKLDHIISIITK